MAIRKVVETHEKDIAFLVDADPTFVSLVRHAASQQPFRVVKSEEKGGEHSMGMVVQSILLPHGVSLESLQAKEGLEWLSDVKSEDTSQHGEYQKLIQLKEEKFDKDSLSLVKLDETGTYALAGQLVDKADAGSALMLGRREVGKALQQIRTAPMDAVIAEEARPSFVLTFRDMFDKELSSFLDVVRGALTQAESGQVQRKKMVMDALLAFKNFLSIGLDALGAKSTKMEKSEHSLKGQEQGGNGMFQFESEKDFTDKVAVIVTGALEKSLKDLKLAPPAKEEKAAGEEAKKEEKKTELEGPLAELLQKVGELGTKVDGVVEKQDKLESQLVTDPAAGISDDDPPVKKEEGIEAEERKPGVFAGLLVRPAPEQRDQVAA